MPTAYTKGMAQTATYWAPGANDGFGGVEFSVTPVAILCRWQDKQDLVRGSQGQEVTSSAVVYVDRELSDKGWLALGDFTGDVDSDGLLDPRDVDGARQIINRGSSPSLSGAQVLYKVWL